MKPFICEQKTFFNIPFLKKKKKAHLCYHKFKQQQKLQNPVKASGVGLTGVDDTHKRSSFLKRHLSRGKC